jgi:hypothetical protein
MKILSQTVSRPTFEPNTSRTRALPQEQPVRSKALTSEIFRVGYLWFKAALLHVQFALLCFNGLYFGESPSFQRKVLPPFLRLKRESSKKLSEAEGGPSGL